MRGTRQPRCSAPWPPYATVPSVTSPSSRIGQQPNLWRCGTTIARLSCRSMRKTRAGPGWTCRISSWTHKGKEHQRSSQGERAILGRRRVRFRSDDGEGPPRNAPVTLSGANPDFPTWVKDMGLWRLAPSFAGVGPVGGGSPHSMTRLYAAAPFAQAMNFRELFHCSRCRPTAPGRNCCADSDGKNAPVTRGRGVAATRGEGGGRPVRRRHGAGRIRRGRVRVTHRS